MNSSSFYLQLAIVTIISVVLLSICYIYLPISEYKDLGIIALVFFVFLSILIFKLAGKASRAKNLNAFTHLVMYNLMIKLFISFIIILVYYYLVKPDERLFILPYIIVYLVFTVFEAIFLSKQARQR